jgi:hypothetical protein
LALAVGACGGATQTQGQTAAGASGARENSDDHFAEYVMSHGGIASLGGKGQGGTFADGLRLDAVQSAVKLDGVLQEWPARARARQVVRGPSGESIAMAIGLQYDDGKLYVGGEVTDEALTRTPRFDPSEDHASIILAFPTSAGQFAAYEIGLFAGKPGESAGSVRVLAGGRRGAEVAGAKILEAPLANGYSFEAAIPWSTFPEARTTRVGLRAAARYYDADGTVIATGNGDPSNPTALTPLPSEAEASLVDQILTPRGLHQTPPKFDAIADVAGDGLKERVTVVDHLLTVCGPGYLGGNRFFFRDLGGDLVRLELRDVTGSGKQDLVIRRRITQGGTTRELLEVLTIADANEEPYAVFAHEISIASGAKRIDNAVRVSGREIEVSVEPAAGWDAGSFREPTVSDVEPVLLPWGGVTSQTYHFDGTRFTKAKEVPSKAGGAAETMSSRGGRSRI